MTGRGKLRLLRSDANPSVKIGLTISVSPSTLAIKSDEPFNIVVIARILESPRPESPVTLCTHLSPLHALDTRAFANVDSVPDASKSIKIYPQNWPHYVWDSEDMGSFSRYVTIPPKGQGELKISHQVPSEAIRVADVSEGERYRAKLTDICLGTVWWTYGPAEDLQGHRLRTWQSPDDQEAQAADDKALAAEDPELKEEIDRETFEKYGDGPTLMSENPAMLTMVPEQGEVEFEVVA